MKYFRMTLCAVLATIMLFSLAACGQTKNDEKTENSANDTAIQANEDVGTETADQPNMHDSEEGETQADLSVFAGTYTMSYDGSEIIIREDGSAEVTLVDLAYMQGEVTGVNKSIVALTVQDPSGNEMGLEFDYETHELFVVDSTWDLLENGTSYQFD